ncbi:MAG TPA: redoxin domain-containing protein [bacterium]|nr:redoxin domain-containing protein [bacterium]HPN45376.1 redoxin domain-containing protein [bacterium]
MKTRNFFVVLIAFMSMLVFVSTSCRDTQKPDIQQAAALVDSVMIKGALTPGSNRDSLLAAQKQLAIQYTDKIKVNKISLEESYAAGKLFNFAEKYEQAIIALQRFDSATVDLKHLELLFELLIDNGKVEQARALFNKNIKPLNPEQPQNYYDYLEYGYLEQSNTTEALAVIDEALTTLDNTVAPLFVLDKAEILFNTGQKDSAYTLLNNLQNQPESDPGMQNRVSTKLNLFNLIGKPAPDILASTWIGSEPIQIKDFQGKVVIVDFWAPWCGPCRATFPHLKKLYTEYHDKGLEIIGVTRFYGRFNQLNQNLQNITPEEELPWIEKFKQHHEIQFPYAIASVEDGMKNATAWGVMGIPHIALIDKKGLVRIYAIGSGKATEDKLEKGVIQLLAE